MANTAVYCWRIECWDDKGNHVMSKEVHLNAKEAESLKSFMHKKHAHISMQKLGPYKHPRLGK